MPRNASKRLTPLFYTVLPARFRAAANPLRIPKVLRKAARDRDSVAWKTLLFYYFIDTQRSYPGWLPQSGSCLLFIEP